MKIITKRINYFSPVDDKGVVKGNYYLDQCGNVVTFYANPHAIYLPYVASVDVENCDDICTLHISEIEDMISKLKGNMDNVEDHDLKMKYTGYIEALNYVVSHNSYIDPWNDFIDSIEGDNNEEI